MAARSRVPVLLMCVIECNNWKGGKKTAVCFYKCDIYSLFLIVTKTLTNKNSGMKLRKILIGILMKLVITKSKLPTLSVQIWALACGHLSRPLEQRGCERWQTWIRRLLCSCPRKIVHVYPINSKKIRKGLVENNEYKGALLISSSFYIGSFIRTEKATA